MLLQIEFLLSLGITLAIEVPLIFILLVYVFRLFKLSKRQVLIVAILASLTSLPYLWFVLPSFVDARLYVYYGEGFVLLLETIIIFLLLRVKFWQAIVTSLLANLSSYFVGLWIFSL
jgi:hypothetical protein